MKKMFPQRFLHPSVEICVHVYEGDDIRDGCMAPPMRWTWVWIDSGSWWWTRKPGTLQSMGSQRVGHDWATELNWYICIYIYIYAIYLLHIRSLTVVTFRDCKGLWGFISICITDIYLLHAGLLINNNCTSPRNLCFKHPILTPSLAAFTVQFL